MRTQFENNQRIKMGHGVNLQEDMIEANLINNQKRQMKTIKKLELPLIYIKRIGKFEFFICDSVHSNIVLIRRITLLTLLF